MSPRVRFNFFIDPEQRAALATIKARDGIPESEQIRRAITAWIDQREADTKTARKRDVARKRA